MNTNPNTFIYGGYVRKSSESEDRQVQSIERQKDDLLLLIEKEKLILKDEIIEENKSAFSIGREGFNTLVKETEKGNINAWMCWHPNRLSRNPMDAGIIVYLLDIGKLHHIRTPSRAYYNTPTDKMVLQFEFMMSKKDSDDKSNFVKSGLNKRYKRGFPNGKTPVGFLNEKWKEQGERGWIVDKKRFDKVQMLFTRFLKGNDSLNTITEYGHNTLKLTTAPGKRQGGKLVTRSVVEKILKNPIYAGFFYSNNKQGKGRTLHTLHEDIPRIISEDEHIKVLNIFGKRHHSKQQKHLTPYTGYIVGKDGNSICADVKLQLICDCGKKFAYRNKENCPLCDIKITEMRNPKYLTYTYYFNIKRRKTKGIPSRGIEESKIDQFLIDFYNNELEISKEQYEWTKKNLVELKSKEIEEDNRRIEIHKQDVIDINSKKEKLRELFLSELLTFEEFKKENQKLDEQLDVKKEQKIYAENWYEQVDTLLDTLFNFDEIIKKAGYTTKKKMLMQLRSNLIWDEEKLFIHKADWLKTFIKGRKTILKKYSTFEPKKSLDFKGLNGVLDDVHLPLYNWIDKIRQEYCKY